MDVRSAADTVRTTRSTQDAQFAADLEGARAGDPAAFRRLYATYASPIRAFGRVRGCDDADELANEVMFAVFRQLDRFRGDEAGFRAWLFRIARNKLIDERRRRSRRPIPADRELTDELVGAVAGDDPVAAGDTAVGALGSALDALTPDQRDVVTLRFVLDLSIEQTAAATGKPVTAVKALQRRGLAALRRQLAELPVSP